METKQIEFYGGPLDGAFREVPVGTILLTVEVQIGHNFSPSGHPRDELHTYHIQLTTAANVIDSIEIFRWAGYEILKTYD